MSHHGKAKAKRLARLIGSSHYGHRTAVSKDVAITGCYQVTVHLGNKLQLVLEGEGWWLKDKNGNNLAFGINDMFDPCFMPEAKR